MANADCTAEAVRIYGNILYRLCILMLKNQADAEDAVQDTFITYMIKAPQFKSKEHEKAWLITVATNKCRDILRKRMRFSDDSEKIISKIPADEEETATLEALMSLPEKFRIVMMLHYVEGYRVEEIAPMIGRTPSAVKMRLQKGRKLLKEAISAELPKRISNSIKATSKKLF